MKKPVILSLFAATVLASACDFNPTGPRTSARVRFVNAIPGLSADVGFTMDEDLISGSIVRFPGFSATCSAIKENGYSMAFGTLNSSRTGLSGPPLRTFTHVLNAGDSYLLIAFGTPTEPVMGLFDNPTATLTANQAGVSFMNLVPISQTAYLEASLTGETLPFSGRVIFAGHAAAEGLSVLSTVASGGHTFTIRDAAGNTVLSNQSIILTARSTNTIAIVPTAAGGYQWMHIRPC